MTLLRHHLMDDLRCPLDPSVLWVPKLLSNGTSDVLYRNTKFMFYEIDTLHRFVDSISPVDIANVRWMHVSCSTNLLFSYWTPKSAN